VGPDPHSVSDVNGIGVVNAKHPEFALRSTAIWSRHPALVWLLFAYKNVERDSRQIASARRLGRLLVNLV
jgi:hypothetical protein